MKIFVRYAKRLLICTGVFLIGILPVFISSTLSYNNDMTNTDEPLVQNGDTAASNAANEIEPEASSHTEQNAEIYPSAITENESHNVRQIIKTYEMSATSSPNCISRETFENAGWQYEFTDITKNVVTENVAKVCSVPVSINSKTKDIDVIISQFTPTLQYSTLDGYTGLLSLDISSIATETVYAVETEEEVEVAAGADVFPDSGLDADISDEPDLVLLDNDDPTYRLTALYTGTISKQTAEKAVYSLYFTGIKITPTPIPTAPAKQEMPTVNNRPVVTKTVALSTSISLAGCLLVFVLFRGNVKVYNLHDGIYEMLGEARIGYTYPVINLTPFTGKAVTGSFVLVLNRRISNRMSDKMVTVNYGGKSLQHIVQSNERGYTLEMNF